MTHSNPINGITSTHLWDDFCATIPNMGQSLTQDLADLLRKLMAEHPELSNPVLIEKAVKLKGGKVGKSTIHRASTGESVLRIDNLEAIAAAFGMKPWMLLRLCDPAPADENEAPLSVEARRLVELIKNAEQSHSVTGDSWKQLAGIVNTMMAANRPAGPIPKGFKR